MALAMSWLAFVGIKGPLDGGARQPSVSLDTDDIDDAEQRDDEGAPTKAGIPSGWDSVEIGEQDPQAPSPAPAAAPESNYPSTASNGQKEPAQDDAHVHVAETSVAPTPVAKKPKKAEAAKPKASTKKTPDVKPATKNAPKKSAPEVGSAAGSGDSGVYAARAAGGVMMVSYSTGVNRPRRL